MQLRSVMCDHGTALRTCASPAPASCEMLPTLCQTSYIHCKSLQSALALSILLPALISCTNPHRLCAGTGKSTLAQLLVGRPDMGRFLCTAR